MTGIRFLTKTTMLPRRLGRVGSRCRHRRLPSHRAMASGTNRHARIDAVVCIDFDLTITTRDTIALLFDAANARRATALERAAHARQVESLVDQYASESRSLVVSVLQETVPGRPFDPKGLGAFLDAFAVLDLRSIRRVAQSKALQGLRDSDVETVAGSVEVMAKSLDVLTLASRAVVISSNWSQTLIRETLRRSGLDNLAIISNELVVNDDGVATGDIELVVQSPLDKATWVKEEMRRSDSPVIFIGDSTNDLLAMLQADVGITLGFAADSTFARVCRQFGVCLVPLAKFKDLLEYKIYTTKRVATNQRVIFTANSWDEIQATLAR